MVFVFGSFMPAFILANHVYYSEQVNPVSWLVNRVLVKDIHSLLEKIAQARRPQLADQSVTNH